MSDVPSLRKDLEARFPVRAVYLGAERGTESTQKEGKVDDQISGSAGGCDLIPLGKLEKL